MSKKEIDKKIAEIRDKIVKEVKPEKIILFGSYAWGKPHEDSDLDLFVVEKSKLNRRQRQIKIRRLFLDFEMPADVLSLTPTEVRQRLKIKDLFLAEIINNGKVIYEKR